MLQTDGARLWAALMAMAEIGATPAGGCNRQALTAEDAAGRALFARWAREAGLSVRTDEIGNLFARRPGTDPEARPILIGSHLDTQPTGGRFDGVYGVLAGLEVIRTLNDKAIRTRSPIELVSWTNEEGARFPPAMMGSGVWAGEFDLAATLRQTDKNGVSVGEALASINAAGPGSACPFPVKGAFELHIEQGPILEASSTAIGVVTGVQGIRWYDLTLTGEPCHAGPTPMEMRADPVQALTVLLPAIFELATRHAPWGRVTIGDLQASPGSRNTVPGSITATIDVRHPDQATLDDMHRSLKDITAGSGPVTVALEQIWHSPAVAFDQHCIEAVRNAAAHLELEALEMVSGAGHDSVYVSRVAPTSMIFIPCRDGLSHNEAEYAAPEDIENGCNVLLNAVLALDAGQRGEPG